ncbi:MAG: hypothetical protein K6G26_10900, partial [Lachnospiraceae bacterium]|nr:hypothetical protein [Lachnospiraceae bacterium]
MKKTYIIFLCIISTITFIFINHIKAKKSDNTVCKYSEFTILEKKPVIKKPCLNLHSKSAILYDRTSNQILYSSNENMRLPNASTTKIMTCITALEQCSLNEVIPVSAYAASMPKVKLGMDKGDSYYLKDLLYSLMLESHNDSAACIAEYIGSKLNNSETQTIYNNSKENSINSILNFTNLMTINTKYLGLNNTNFITPNGLDNDNHYSCAKDLA